MNSPNSQGNDVWVCDCAVCVARRLDEKKLTERTDAPEDEAFEWWFANTIFAPSNELRNVARAAWKAARSERGVSALSKYDLIRAAIACEQIWAMDLGERLREAAELARVNEAGENLHAKLRETEAALAQSKHDLAREVTIAAHECAERVRLQGELAKARMVLEWAQQNIDCVEDADERKRCSVAIDAFLKSPAQGEKINAAGRGKP